MAYQEHRCQCCGDITDAVFCEDCQEHMKADEQAAAKEDAEEPNRDEGQKFPL